MTQLVAVVAAWVVLLALASPRLGRSPVTTPMVAVGSGLLLGPGLGLLPVALEGEVLRLLAELTLVVLLFVDATRVDPRVMRDNGQVPARMLLLGLPLTVALGTAAGVGLLGLGVATAAVLACVLAPTDAALAQAVLVDDRLPVRVRQALNVESGLNDGLVAPLFVVALALAGVEDGGGSPAAAAVRLVVVGAVVGAVAGGGVGALVRRIGRARLDRVLRQLAVLAVPLLAWAVAVALDGNGFVAAFVAGLAFGAVVPEPVELVEFSEDTGELLELLTFLAFGAVFLPEAVAAITPSTVGYVLLALTVVRMVPIALSLLGTGLVPWTSVLLGWFGPRGLATVVFALEVVDTELPGGERLFGVAALAILVSVVVHGLSARPLAGLYGAALRRGRVGTEQMREDQHVPEIRMRLGQGARDPLTEEESA